MKALTVRLEDTLAEELEIVAACDGETVADAIRAAVATWIGKRGADPNFQAALRRRIEAEQRLLLTETGETVRAVAGSGEPTGAK